MLAGGREVKSWIADLHDPKPQVRRQAVLKLGNVGDADPAAAEGLAEALRDSDAIVRRDAVSAVAKLSKPSEEIMAWLRIMGDRDRDPRVRDYAKRAITHFEKWRNNRSVAQMTRDCLSFRSYNCHEVEIMKDSFASIVSRQQHSGRGLVGFSSDPPSAGQTTPARPPSWRRRRSASCGRARRLTAVGRATARSPASRRWS